MDPNDPTIAAEFLRLVQSADLLEYLGLPRTAGAGEATAALTERRKRLQGMQNNPKYRDSARFLLKNFQALLRVASDPVAHLEHTRKARESELLPSLHMAIDSVLADGAITAEEEAFVRRSALALGISEETYARVLRERTARVGIHLPPPEPSAGPPAWKGGKTARVAEAARQPPVEVQGAAEHPWWDASFTRLLLQVIPGGPGALVDVYARGGTSALTVLPQRRQLTWTGLDRNPARVEAGRAALAPLGDRARLELGTPDRVPLDDASVDTVLAVRALAYLPDTRAVFAEAGRVLRPGGRLVVAEPDGLAEAFYFDGHLEGYNAAFHSFGLRIDGAMRAAGVEGGAPGLALGPELARRVAGSGLSPVSTSVHAASTLRPLTFGRLARQLRRYPRALAEAGGLVADDDALAAIDGEVDELEARFPPEAEGLGGHVLPMFLVVAVKEG